MLLFPIHYYFQIYNPDFQNFKLILQNMKRAEDKDEFV